MFIASLKPQIILFGPEVVLIHLALFLVRAHLRSAMMGEYGGGGGTRSPIRTRVREGAWQVQCSAMFVTLIIHSFWRYNFDFLWYDNN